MFPKYFQFMSLHFKSSSIYDFLLQKIKKKKKRNTHAPRCSTISGI